MATLTFKPVASKKAALHELRQRKPSKLTVVPRANRMGGCCSTAKAQTNESPATGRPLRVIISGAPASGKGTQCENIVDEFGLTHISAGDLLRAAVKENTEAGQKAKEFMNAGKLVPDEIIVTMITQRLEQEDCKKNGWLLDGYPRSASQADALEKANIRPDLFLQVNVPDEKLIERVIGRRMDPETGKIYHMTFFPPENEEIETRLIQRSDDTEEKARTRLEVYHSNVDAVIGLYKDSIAEIDGDRSKEEVFMEIRKAITAATAQLV